MNERTKRKLAKMASKMAVILDQLNSLEAQLDTMRDAAQAKLDAMSDRARDGEKGQAAEVDLEVIEGVLYNIGHATEYLENARGVVPEVDA